MDIVLFFVLKVLLHALMFASLGIFILGIYQLIDKPKHGEFDRHLRAAMTVAGALIVLATRVSGASIEQYFVGLLKGATPLFLGEMTGAFGCAGIVFGYIFRKVFYSRDERAGRVLILLSTIAAFEFVLVYAQTFAVGGLSLGPPILPNIAFIVGLLLYLGLAREPYEALSLDEPLSPLPSEDEPVGDGEAASNGSHESPSHLGEGAHTDGRTRATG